MSKNLEYRLFTVLLCPTNTSIPDTCKKWPIDLVTSLIHMYRIIKYNKTFQTVYTQTIFTILYNYKLTNNTDS